MSKYLDLKSWSRREVFEFYLGFDKPYFNICTRLDVTNLVALVRRRGNLNVSLAYHYFALRAANEIEPFRYRLRDGKVFVHDVIHGGTTVLLPNESFNFAYFDYVEDFHQFIADAARNVAAVRTANPPLKSKEGDDRVYFTTLPWISFTSFRTPR
jgi:chloramphenicol O-acetyltransferase type A